LPFQLDNISQVLNYLLQKVEVGQWFNNPFGQLFTHLGCLSNISVGVSCAFTDDDINTEWMGTLTQDVSSHMMSGAYPNFTNVYGYNSM